VANNPGQEIVTRKAKIGLISLGCSKNLVDSEILLGTLQKEGHAVSTDIDDADVVIVNTCTFIREATEESVGAILEAIELKKDEVDYWLGLIQFVGRLEDAAVWFAALAGLGLAGLGALAFFPNRLLGLASLLMRPLPQALRTRLLEFAGSIVGSMRALRSPGRVAAAALLSFAIWSMFPLSTYALSRAFDLDLPFLGALVVQVCVTAAVVAPQAPGFIGPFHVATMEAVKLFGVSEAGAGAFALTLWAVNVVPITVVGLAFLRHEGLNLLRLARASERAAAGAEPAAGEDAKAREA